MDEIAPPETKKPCTLQDLAHIIADRDRDIHRLRREVMWLFKRLLIHEPNVQPEIAAEWDVWADEEMRDELSHRLSYNTVCETFRIPREGSDG